MKKINTGDTSTNELLTRAYREASQESPPSALDTKILAEAHAAVDRRVLRRRWVIPMSIAAVALLCVGVVVRLLPLGPSAPSESYATLDEAPTTTAAEKKTEVADSSIVTQARRRAPAKSPENSPEKSKIPNALAKAQTESHLSPAAPAPADSVARREVAGTVAGAAASQDRAALMAASAPPSTARITALRISGVPGAYRFEVTIASADTDCTQYADWWEVLSEDGKLIYRDVWSGSHVNAQPFTRISAAVALRPETVVWVRAHMNNSGYAATVYKGSVERGFVGATLSPDFAADVARQPPLPPACAR